MRGNHRTATWPASLAAMLTVVLALTPSIALAHTSRAPRGAAGLDAKTARGKHRTGKQTSESHGERNVEASIVLKLTPPEESLPQTRQINLFVPERFRDAGTELAHCNSITLTERGVGSCPKRSLVGGGKATGYTILGGDFVIEHLSVTVFNGPHGSLLTWVEGRKPVIIEQVVEGVITKPHGFGTEMSFTIPQGLLEPLPGAPGWMQTLEAHLSGSAGWLRSSSCPEHPYALKAELGYVSGQGISIEAKLKCV